MAGIEDFVAAPCEEFLDHCTKDQLLKIAEECEVDLGGLTDRRRKETKAFVKLQLAEKGVLVVKHEGPAQPQAVAFSHFQFCQET